MGEASHESYASTLANLAPNASISHASSVEIAELPSVEGLANYDGIFLAGSPIQMHKENEASRSAAAFMALVFRAGVPSFGSCAGLQIAAVAAGGESGPRKGRMETAFARGIVATPQGREHPLLKGRPVSWDAPAMHSSIVLRMPEGGRVLAQAPNTPVEAAEIRFLNGVFWGVQYHPELSVCEIAGALRRQREDLLEEGLARDEASLLDYADLLDQIDADPSRHDIAWRIGIDEQVSDTRLRTLELSNFLAHVEGLKRA